MEVDARVRYEQAFEQWRAASNIRFKILGAWWAVYIGTAVVFQWVWTQAPELRGFTYLIPIVAAIAGVLFWLMDELNGRAIYASKSIVEALEAEAATPVHLQMVKASSRGWVPPHYWVIRTFAALSVAFFLFAAGYLKCLGG